MNNYTNDNTARRYIAHLSTLGTTQIHLRNPYIIAWWSAAFPGIGHLLLSKYIRGFLLFIWEFLVNINANVNLAIIHSFQGNFDTAINVLDPNWALIYMPVYLFAIWDSYRTTVDLNKVFVLAEREEHRFNFFNIGALEINYLDKRNPLIGMFWSSFVPGLGQLYIHRLFVAFIGVFSTTSLFYLSHLPEAITFLILGDVQQATSVLNPKWLLFLPSIYGFSIYDAYVNAIENNKLFEKVQRRYLQDHYQNPDFRIKKTRE